MFKRKPKSIEKQIAEEARMAVKQLECVVERADRWDMDVLLCVGDSTTRLNYRELKVLISQTKRY